MQEPTPDPQPYSMMPRTTYERACSPQKQGSKTKRDRTPAQPTPIEKQSSKKINLEKERDRLKKKRNERVLKSKGPPPKKTKRPHQAAAEDVPNPKEAVDTAAPVDTTAATAETEDGEEQGNSPPRNTRDFIQDTDHPNDVDDDDLNEDSQRPEEDSDVDEHDDPTTITTTFARGVRRRTDVTTGGRPSPSTPSKKKKGHGSIMTQRRKDMERLQADGWLAWINATARQAVFDAGPHEGEGKPLSQHLYWALNPRVSCALNLIRREPELQKEAVEFGSIELLAQEICDTVIKSSRKARNKHINELRQLFFKNGSEFKIVDHVLEANMKDDDDNTIPMLVCDGLFSDLPTADSIAELLMSSEMHAHKEFYPHFVRAIATGRFCRMRKQLPDRPLAAFLSVTHEAHFRLELWLCLKQQGQLWVCLYPPVILY